MSNKLVKGAAIIGIAGLIVKFLGAFFRIPLTNWIGDIGMSYYSFAYSIYASLLVLSTAGIPIAISRMVSENVAKKQYRNAHKVFKLSMVLMVVIGGLSALICFAFGGALTRFLGNAEAKTAVMAIAPALFFVPVVSSIRGYFQGRQNMKPTAISEITEQLVRVIVGLTLAYYFLRQSLRYAAAGAAFGASIGSFGALLVMTFIYLLDRKGIKRRITVHSQHLDSSKVILRRIIIISVPIIIGSEIMPIMGLIDAGMIMNRLQGTGWSHEESKALFGLISGFCGSLIAFPQIFTQSVAISLVPAVSRANTLKEHKAVRKNINLGYRTTMIMAFPCALGLMFLAKPILLLLYPMQHDAAIKAAPTLMIMSIGVISLSISQTSTGVLQAIDKQVVPVYNLLIGCVLKIILTFILVGIPIFNIKGAAIGTTAAETVSFLLNNRAVRKHTKIKFEYKKIYIKPLMAASIMGISVYLIQYVLNVFLGNSLSTIISILFGAVIYGIFIILLKAIDKSEIETMKGGDKLLMILNKTGLSKLM